MRSGHAGPVTMGRTTCGPPCWTRSQDETTSSQVFVRRRVGRRVSLPVVLPPRVQRGRRRHRAKGGVFAFAPTLPSPPDAARDPRPLPRPSSSPETAPSLPELRPKVRHLCPCLISLVSLCARPILASLVLGRGGSPCSHGGQPI
jgi:hypothetical protein